MTCSEGIKALIDVHAALDCSGSGCVPSSVQGYIDDLTTSNVAVVVGQTVTSGYNTADKATDNITLMDTTADNLCTEEWDVTYNNGLYSGKACVQYT
jgi:hypothetical protein